MTSRLRLDDVTVCAADCQHPSLAAEAIEACLQLCDFSDAILFSHVPVEGSFRNVAVRKIENFQDYSRFCLQDLPALVETSYVLIVQWDGYVVEPSAWSRAFLKYDYVGAVWSQFGDGMRVGNGGFSLRSRRLLEAVKKLPFISTIAEDIAIGRSFRRLLERDHAIRFAPEKLAEQFSFETTRPAAPTFGFHGLFNLWRFKTDDGLTAVLDQLSAAETTGWQFVILMMECLLGGRREIVRRHYPKFRERKSADDVRRMLKYRVPLQPTDSILAQLEEMCFIR